MLFTFVLDYAKFCGSIKIVDHFLLLQDLIRFVVKPLLTHSYYHPHEAHSISAHPSKEVAAVTKHPSQALKTVLKFLFSAFKVPNFLQVMFLLNDFLVFRSNEVLGVLRLAMEKLQSLSSRLAGEEIFTCLQGLRFDCTVLLQVLRTPDQPSLTAERTTITNEKSLPIDEMFTKMVYVLKKEVSSSTVADHQNSLGYNGRDQSVVSDFFDTLQQFLLSFDHISYQLLLMRLSKFPNEVFSCCHEFLVKILPQFGRDARKALACLQITATHCADSPLAKVDENDSNGICATFNSSYLTAMLYLATKKILESLGQQYTTDHFTQFASKRPWIRLDLQLLSHISEIRFGCDSFTVSDPRPNKALLARKCTENLLLHESHLYRTSITERYFEFVLENFSELVDSCSFAASPEFFSLISCVQFFLKQSPTLDLLIRFLDMFGQSIVTRTLRRFSVADRTPQDWTKVPDPPVLHLAQVKPNTVWRSFVYLHLLAENADSHPLILGRFLVFVKANFSMFAANHVVFASSYTDRISILHRTLTTLNPEVTMSACSSFTDALLSYLTDEDDTHERVFEQDEEKSSILDSIWVGSNSRTPTAWSVGYLEDINNMLFRKPNRCLFRSVIQRSYFFSADSMWQLVRWMQQLLLAVNITHRGLKLVVLFLEATFDILLAKDTADFSYYKQGRDLLASLFSLDTNITGSPAEQEFKIKLQAMKHHTYIVSLLRGYFCLKLELKIIQNTPKQADRLAAEAALESVHFAGSPYLRLMIGVFTSHVKRMISGLSIRLSGDMNYVQSWKDTLSLFLKSVHHVKKFLQARSENSHGSSQMGKMELPKSFEMSESVNFEQQIDVELGNSLGLKKSGVREPTLIGLEPNGLRNSNPSEIKLGAVGPADRGSVKEQKEPDKSGGSILGLLEGILQEISDNIRQNRTQLNSDIVSVGQVDNRSTSRHSTPTTWSRENILMRWSSANTLNSSKWQIHWMLRI